MKKLLQTSFLLCALMMRTSSAPVSASGAASAAGATQSARAEHASLAENPGVASAIQLLESWMESHVAYHNVPGVSLGIVKDQQLVWAKGFGYSDVSKRTPATPSTVYRIGSITKLFTAISVMQLRDAGKLQLDDPVVKYLPWFRIRGASTETPSITIRQLLTHTSGLPAEAAFPYWNDGKFPTREQLRESIPNQELVFAPATRLKYSNLGFSLLGEIVSAVSREPYEVYVQKHILEPSGMTSTSVVLTEAEKKRVAVGYGRRMPDGTRRIMPFQDLKALSPAGNMSSTVEDMARFASMLFRQENPVLKGSTIAEMERVQWIRPDWRGGFGLGFTLRPHENGLYAGHEGWVPGYRTRIRLSTNERIAVIVLSNADDTDTSLYADQVYALLASAIKAADAGPEQRATTAAAPSWSKYVGQYSNDWGDYQVLIINNSLMLVAPTDLYPSATMLPLVPDAQGRFRIVSSIADGTLDGEVVTFESALNGEITSMKIGETTYPRIKPGERRSGQAP